MSKRVAHIDADIICYSVGFASENDPVSFALHSVKRMIEKIMEATNADEYVCYLSGPTNFRDDIAVTAPYKGNRKSNKPKHYAKIREYLTDVHGAIISDNCEADDLIGIACTAPDDNVNICCTLDKDLNMIPGPHYNWKKDELFEISKEEAEDFFIIQLLTGDPTDNIPGLYKITGTKATKKYKEHVTEPSSVSSKFTRVIDVYHSIEYGSTVHLREIADLLWIKQYEYDTWLSYIDGAVNEEKED
jgi:5'-3' exonuclease